MTVNGHYALYYITCLSFGAHHKNLNAYCQRQKYSPVNVVSSDIRVMQGFGRYGASNEKVVDCRFSYLSLAAAIISL